MNFTQKLDTHIIITRYNEADISKIINIFSNKKNTKIFIYNKGTNIPLGIPTNNAYIKIINIENIGWDSYPFFYHVINNYNNLPEYIYLIHASAQYLHHKLDIIYSLIQSDNNNKKYYGGQLMEVDLDFRLLEWNATYKGNSTNSQNNPNNIYIPSDNYPLGNWLKSKIDKIPDFAKSKNNHIYWNPYGMFLVHKSRILRYPKSFYIDILNEISHWQTEVNHYLERSWYIFYGGDD
jgi:hypothetical protein